MGLQDQLNRRCTKGIKHKIICNNYLICPDVVFCMFLDIL